MVELGVTQCALHLVPCFTSRTLHIRRCPTSYSSGSCIPKSCGLVDVEVLHVGPVVLHGPTSAIIHWLAASFSDLEQGGMLCSSAILARPNTCVFSSPDMKLLVVAAATSSFTAHETGVAHGAVLFSRK